MIDRMTLLAVGLFDGGAVLRRPGSAL